MAACSHHHIKSDELMCEAEKGMPGFNPLHGSIST
jgi:hypothetical protein